MFVMSFTNASTCGRGLAACSSLGITTETSLHHLDCRMCFRASCVHSKTGSIVNVFLRYVLPTFELPTSELPTSH